MRGRLRIAKKETLWTFRGRRPNEAGSRSSMVPPRWSRWSSRTLGLRSLKPAAPRVDRSAVWIDSVQKGPLVIEVRGPGDAGTGTDPLHLRGDRGSRRATAGRGGPGGQAGDGAARAEQPRRAAAGARVGASAHRRAGGPRQPPSQPGEPAAQPGSDGRHRAGGVSRRQAKRRGGGDSRRQAVDLGE